MKKSIFLPVVFTAVIFIFSYGYSNESTLERVIVLNMRLDKIRHEQIKKEYGKNGKRDPFVSLTGISKFLKTVDRLAGEGGDLLSHLPYFEKNKNSYPFILSGIIYSEKNDSLVIINNKIRKIGENIDGASIVGIESKKVKLLWKNKEIYLSTEGLSEGGMK